MPNPYHFRARIDRICRRAFGNGPAYLQLRALDTLVRELHAPNDRARRNYKMYLATDPYDVARHKLRDLYDRPGSLCPPLPLGERWGEGSAGSLGLPLPLGEGWGEGSLPSAQPGLALQEGDPADEDDDPL